MRADVDRVSRKLGRRLTFLVGKPGLDGHSNGAEQIAVRARDAGMEVVYEGIRLTPEEIVDAAREQKAHVVGLSILSGCHVPLVKDVVEPAEGRPASTTCRSWSAASFRRRTPNALEAGRRRRGLHAEGFRAQPHHGGRGADRRNASADGRLTAPAAQSAADRFRLLIARRQVTSAFRVGENRHGTRSNSSSS